MTDQTFVGVDVAKAWLDIHHACHGATRINNSHAAVRSFAAPLRQGGSLGRVRSQWRLRAGIVGEHG